MYSMNRIGQNRPLGNNRQFVTMGIINHHPEEMKLKPEYLGNEHFKFLNNFGLPQQFITDKKFVDINNCVNQHHSNNYISLNPSHILQKVPNTVMLNCTASYHTNYGRNFYKGVDERLPSKSTSIELPNLININNVEDTNKFNMATNQEEVDVCSKSSPKDCEESQGGSNMKLPRKTKRNCKTQCDKVSQKSSKKSKRPRNYQKRSKRESDRNVIGNSESPRKRNNRNTWHKKSLEKEIMDIDDTCFYSNSDRSLESPFIITSLCSTTTSLPNIQSVCIQTTVNNLSSPIKVNSESKVQNNKHSLASYDFRGEQQSDNHMCQSPKQNDFRPRLPSECESEDSFIVFEEGSISIEEEDDQESTDYDSSSDEDSDDSDVMDFCITTLNQNNHLPRTSSPTKKVRFAVGKDLCEVHPMVQWSFAYRKARKGPWEQFAVDRVRFKNRVSNMEPILNVILQPEHRRKVYKERFQLDDN